MAVGVNDTVGAACTQDAGGYVTLIVDDDEPTDRGAIVTPDTGSVKEAPATSAGPAQPVVDAAMSSSRLLLRLPETDPPPGTASCTSTPVCSSVAGLIG